MRKETGKITTNQNISIKSKSSIKNRASRICKTNPILPVPVGDSGVIYAKKITKNCKKIQNNPKECKRNCKKPRSFALIYPPKADFSSEFTKKNAHFSQFLQPKSICFSSTLQHFYSFSRRKRSTFFTFHNFQTKRYLTPCTIKTYINSYTCLRQFYPNIPLKRGIYPPSFWRKKMQNKPNFNQRTTSHERRKYAKRTQFHSAGTNVLCY